MAQGKRHEPTDEQRQLVELHSTIGTRQDNIARIIGIDLKTLHKHYRDELDLGMDKANQQVGGALFSKALDGDTASMIFWMKTRARWSERSKLDLLSSDGTMTPASPLSIEELRKEVKRRGLRDDIIED